MQCQHPGQALVLCLSKAALPFVGRLAGVTCSSLAAGSNPGSPDPACLIQGAVASGAPEQAGRDTQCRGCDLLPGALEAGCSIENPSRGDAKENGWKIALGLFTWRLAGSLLVRYNCGNCFAG